nr:MAG TPA: hypothetical protein [Caudoviricetes sp.]
MSPILYIPIPPTKNIITFFQFIINSSCISTHCVV